MKIEMDKWESDMAILHYFQFLFVSVILVFKLMTTIRFGISIVTLGCTDTAKWPPHPRSMWCLARDAAACTTNRVQFFFFFFLDSRWLAPIRLWRVPICTDSGWIGSYWPNIDVFWPEKGNWPVKKKKKLKPKIPVDIDTRQPLSPAQFHRP